MRIGENHWELVRVIENWWESGFRLIWESVTINSRLIWESARISENYWESVRIIKNWWQMPKNHQELVRINENQGLDLFQNQQESILDIQESVRIIENQFQTYSRIIENGQESMKIIKNQWESGFRLIWESAKINSRLIWEIIMNWQESLTIIKNWWESMRIRV